MADLTCSTPIDVFMQSSTAAGMRSAVGVSSVVNIKTDFSAKVDGRMVVDAAITNGSATLSSASAAFTSDDVGKVIVVVGAGASNNDLVSTISSVGGSTSATLATTASSTVSNSYATYGTDDTAAWQAAIDSLSLSSDLSVGGTITSPDGISMIAGALIATGSYNTQIKIPTRRDTFAIATISIVGVTPPPATPWQYKTGHPPTTGLILFSTVFGSGTRPSVIGAESTPANCQDGTTNVFVCFTNTTIRTLNNAGMTAYNLYNVAQTRLENVVADRSVNAYGDGWNLKQPTATTEYGIRLPKGGNMALAMVTNGLALGYYTGFFASEHGNLRETCSQSCYRSLEILDADNPVIVISHKTLQCPYGIVATAGTYRPCIRALGLTFERGPANNLPLWMMPVADIYDPDNVMDGRIEFETTSLNGDAKNTLVINGASYCTLSCYSSGLTQNLASDFQSITCDGTWQNVTAFSGLTINGGGDWDISFMLPIDFRSLNAAGGYPADAFSRVIDDNTGLAISGPNDAAEPSGKPGGVRRIARAWDAVTSNSISTEICQRIFGRFGTRTTVTLQVKAASGTSLVINGTDAYGNAAAMIKAA